MGARLSSRLPLYLHQLSIGRKVSHFVCSFNLRRVVISALIDGDELGRDPLEIAQDVKQVHSVVGAFEMMEDDELNTMAPAPNVCSDF